MNKRGDFGIDQTGYTIWHLLIGLAVLSGVVLFVMLAINKKWISFEWLFP